jgi:hypothetical protein
LPDLTRRHVPALTQYATASLIPAIAYQGHPPGDDPDWASSGAPDRDAYGFWCGRWCGLVCLRMALLTRNGHAPMLFELLQQSLEFGCYRVNGDGTVDGLFYQPFTEYVDKVHRLKAEVITDLTTDRLADELTADRLVITSVHKEIRRPDRPAPGRGGHLVLVTGHRSGTVLFNNPSGHTPETTSAVLPADVFDQFSARRGISLTL